MKFFELRFTRDIKLTGKSLIQCTNIPDNVPEGWLNGPDATSNFDNTKPIEFENKLLFQLENDAVLTDVVKASLISSTFLLVNQKTMSLLNTFDLPHTSIHYAKVVANGRIHNYYYIHFIWDGFPGLDFEKTKFIMVKNRLLRSEKSECYVLNYKDWERQCFESKRSIISDEIHLNDSFLADLFGFPYIVMNYLFISERLRNALIENKITGIEIIEQDVLNPHCKITNDKL